jgi:tetratricopeptide (TPR) repeat protein
MKCIYCGTELSDGSEFCSRCGKKVQIVKEFEALEDEYLTGILEQGQQSGMGGMDDAARKKRQQAKRAREKQKQKKMRLIILSFVVAALIIIGIIVGFYVKFSVENERANSYDYQLSMAESAYADGNLKAAIDYYENALALEPDHTDVRLKLAEIYYDRKDYDSAQLLYLETLKEEPSNKECYRMLISIYEQKNKTQEILDLCSNVTDPEILSLFSDYIVNSPEFSEAGGTYDHYMEIAITSDKGHQIYYTMDGTDPETYGRLYNEPLSLDSAGTYTIRAVCVNNKKLYSDIVTQEYVIDIPAPSMPVVTPNGGTFEEETLVSVTVPDGCTAYYTWDGTIPTTSSSRYWNALSVPEGNNILSVMIVDDKTGKWSDIYRGRFVYYPPSEEPSESDAPEAEETDDTDMEIE